MTQPYFCEEKLDVGHSQGLKGYMTPIEFTYGVFVGQTAPLNIPQLHWL